MKARLKLWLAELAWASGSVRAAKWAIPILKSAGYTDQDLVRMPR